MSCSSPDRVSSDGTLAVADAQGPNDITAQGNEAKRKFSNGLKTIDMALGQPVAIAPASLKRNLYGRFFNDRAEYYIIENPSNTLMQSAIKRAILYYFDGKLYRVKYQLSEDKSSQLIRSRPSFSIRGLTERSRDILAAQSPVKRNSVGNYEINPSVDDYELTWRSDDIIVKWRRVKSEKFYEYSEYSAEYTSKYRELQNDQIPVSQSHGTYTSW